MEPSDYLVQFLSQFSLVGLILIQLVIIGVAILLYVLSERKKKREPKTPKPTKGKDTAGVFYSIFAAICSFIIYLAIREWLISLAN